MGYKGQKYNNYSAALKEAIIFEYFNGCGSSYALAKKYGISRNSLKNWILKAKQKVDFTADGRGRLGKPKIKNLTLNDYKERYEILKKYQAFLLARRGKK